MREGQREKREQKAVERGIGKSEKGTEEEVRERDWNSEKERDW